MSVTRNPVQDEAHTPFWLERWGIWITISVLLILFAYTVPIYEIIANAGPGSPGYRTW